MVFTPDERNAVDAAASGARDALLPLGLWPPGGVYLLHRRAVVRATRATSGRKATHAQVAGATLEWARAAGDVRLYVLVALAAGVSQAHGANGLEAAVSAYPDLAMGLDAMPAMDSAMRSALCPSVSSLSEAASPAA